MAAAGVLVCGCYGRCAPSSRCRPCRRAAGRSTLRSPPSTARRKNGSFYDKVVNGSPLSTSEARMRATTLAALACSLVLVACGTSANTSRSAAQPPAPSTVRVVATGTAPTATAAVPRPTATPAGYASPQATPAATAAAAVSVMLTQPAGDPQQWHFAPATVTVKAGGTVTWTNPKGNEIHTVTADDGKT